MTNNTLGPRKQIFCADGHQDTCSFVSYLLTPFGYKVTTVNDMSNGLRIARAVNYDLYMVACKLSDGDRS
jgi:DNA-binding response OmpR family regulator